MLFQQRNQLQGQINYSEVGMSAAQAKECGVTSEYKQGWPARCPTSTPDQPVQRERRRPHQCWTGFDKNLMENVVPWVPYLWGNNLTVLNKDVTQYVFDQFSGIISLCHIAVSNNATIS